MLRLSRALVPALSALALTVVVPAIGDVAVASAQIAVVTQRGSTVQDLSTDELRQLFLGQVTTLAQRTVTLVEHTPSRPGFYRAVLGMGEAQIDRHWIGVVFRGSASAPRKMDDVGALKSFVAMTPGAIAFLAIELVDETVQVITIDGVPPTAADYPIRP